MTPIYFYKMTADNFGAPHVANNMLTLAICKPDIRRTAPKGSLIFGFAGNCMGRDNALLYAAIVEPMDGRVYYSDADFRCRGDRIYKWAGNDFQLRAQARYHSDHDERPRDVGVSPNFHNAKVLISRGNDYRYFGAHGSSKYKERCPLLTKRLTTLGQGHLNHHVPELREELLALKACIWRDEQMIKVEPCDPPENGQSCNSCSDDEGSHQT